MDEETNIQIPSVDDMAPEYMNELPDDGILDTNVRTSRGGMLSTFDWGLKACILAKQDGWRLEKRGSYTLTYLPSNSGFWWSKSSPMGRNDPEDYSSSSYTDPIWYNSS